MKIQLYLHPNPVDAVDAELKPPNPVLGAENGLAKRFEPVLVPVPKPPNPVDAVV